MITSKYFGTTKNGEEVLEYTLTNKNGMKVNILTYAAVVKDVILPVKGGLNVKDGFETLAEYEADTAYHGAFVGRYANRIKDARFELNGKTYELPKNDGENHLHGIQSFRVFKAEVKDEELILTTYSPDGDEGFPGNMTMGVGYRLTDDNDLFMRHFAKGDQDCPVNLTNHGYYCLNGREVGTLGDMELFMPADFVTRDVLDFSGKRIDVTGTRYDYRQPRPLESELIDDNFVIADNSDMKLLARVRGLISGCSLEIYSTQPALQIYNGNGKSAALETQHYPLSLSFPQYPNTILKAGECYEEISNYKFFF